MLFQKSFAEKHSLFPNCLKFGCLMLSFLIAGCEGDVGRVNENNSASHASNPSSNGPQTNLVFAPAAALAGAPDPLSSFTELDVDSGVLTLEELQSLIFIPYCAGCHTGQGDELPASLNLSSSADTYASTIGATSTEDPRLSLVEPEQSTNSYLIRKIEGTQSVGQRMPLNQDPLPEWMISAIKRWIDAGATF